MSKDGLIFLWPGRHHLHLLLPLAVLAAIAVHMALFFLFSIIYPRPDSGAVNAAEVFVVLPGSAESARLAALLESGDPSIFAPGRGLPVPESRRAGYTPQYASAEALIEPLPALAGPPVHVSPTFAPVPFRLAETLRPPGPVRPPSLRWSASEGLAARTILPASPQADLWPDPGSNPAPVGFLASVRPDGSIAHLFPQRGSGSEDFDKKAADVARRLKFSPAHGEETWGMLTLEWGAP